MNEYLKNLFETNKAINAKGESVELNSSVDRQEAEFIFELITGNQLRSAIEIGCAMGVSSLAIADALKKVTGGDYRHYIIDPYQTTEWQSIGITGLQRNGFTKHTLLERGSEFALPDLCEQGMRFDFGFIDGWHTFDHTLLDFFYINRMLSVGGIVVIDDICMPGINKCVRYISNYPAYEYCSHVPSPSITVQRKLLDMFRSVTGLSKYILRKRIAHELFSAETVLSDSRLHLHSNMIAFRKIKEDNRPWNWHIAF